MAKPSVRYKGKLNIRDVTFMKPKGRETWLTISELSTVTNKDTSWLRRLEAQDRIPKARRFPHGAMSIRLWSPKQVEEIHVILSRMQVGRPKKVNS